MKNDDTATLFSAAQTFDTHGRVTRIDLDGGANWDYEYDSMGQVTAGVKRDSGGTALPGYTFGYGFDTIGNRETATRESQTDDYWTNALNQITTIEYQGYHHILGSADPAATVTVDGLATQRSNSLFYGSVSGGNTYEQFEIRGVLAGAGDGGADAVSVIDAAAYIPESSNTFTHDESGNLTEDAEWIYTWDAENRLVQIETRPSVVTAGAPHRRLTFEYDSQSRRTRKTAETWDGTAWQTDEDIRFLWNDWLLSAELEADTLEPIRSYTWGPDLAGTREQTGGVGGLVLVKHHKNGEVTVPLYTTNGNVRGYWEIDAAELVAEFEYGPFGELLRATGDKTEKHPFRFSTKYEDGETGLVYYGYRFFDTETGRWLNRDPIEEKGGLNLYGFVGNDPIGVWDYLGLDFITLAARDVALPFSLGFLQHYSIELWEADCPIPENPEYEYPSFLNDWSLANVSRTAGVELLVDNRRWSAETRGESRNRWRPVEFSFSYISFSDFAGIKFKVAYQPAFQNRSNAADVSRKWREILNAANSYPYAESDGFVTPQKFPDSRYFLPPGNNSNTFGRWLLNQVNIPIPNLSGVFPGAGMPRDVPDHRYRNLQQL